MAIGRRWKERGETLMPASLAALAVVLDMSVDGESFAHVVAVASVALAAALSGAAAVISFGRFGPSGLGRRFAIWRAGGLLAAASCLALEVVQRCATPHLPADGTVQLSVLGAAWALLTGWVWGRRSWEQVVAGLAVPGPEGEVPEGDARSGVRWSRRKMGEV
jgi:hypothetical protein